jgi:L-amino acid N-acyltransferase YncA
MTINPMTEAHWPAVKAIYEAAMASGNATFETQAPAWKAWDQAHLGHSRLVAVDNSGTVLGWAALSGPGAGPGRGPAAAAGPDCGLGSARYLDVAGRHV